MKIMLTVEIEYDPATTDPEGLACAMDRLLETALSTPDILDEFGNPTVGGFYVVKETALPAPKVILNISGGVLQDVFGSDPAITVARVDWDTEGSDPSEKGIVEIPDGRGGTQLVNVAEYPVLPLTDLVGTETEAALKAAGLELTQPANRTVARRWVLFSIDTNTLLTTRTYDSYEEAVADANQVDDILVLPLMFKELHAQPTVEDVDTMNALMQYTLHIDGELFRVQRELLTKIADLARQKQPYSPMPGDEVLLDGLVELTDAIADQAHDQHGIDCLLVDDDDTRCECEKPGFFCSGIPGILAHMENGRLAKGAKVNRCDLCQRYPSDEAAFEKMRELGHAPP
jgi:hypothetical protein